MSYQARQNIRGIQGLLDSHNIISDRMFERKYLKTEEMQQMDAQIDNIDKKIEELDQLLYSEKQSFSSKSSQQSTQSKSNKSSSNKSKYHKSNKMSQRIIGNQLEIPREFLDIQQQMSKKHLQQPSIQQTSVKSWQPTQGDPYCNQLKKIDLIDDIYELKQQLLEERVSLDYLPPINEDTEIATLKNVKQMLLRKVRKLQSNNIVEDSMFLVLKGVESVMDGKTEVFGFKPNLKGLSKAITLKLRNQKVQFSDTLETVCSQYGIGNNSKLFTQILISAVKRGFVNKDESSLEDQSANMKILQEMYNQQ